MKHLKKLFFQKFIAILTITALVSVFLASYWTSKAAVNFQTGDIFKGKNLTVGQASYSDPVSATTGERIRLNILVWNQGSDPATNTNVTFDLTNATQPKATITADGGIQLSDVVVINPSGTTLTFVSGSGKMYGPGCASGCNLTDGQIASGVSLGTVNTGGTNSFQITIEADITGSAAPSQTAFNTGNIFDGGNRSRALASWEDPIPADPGETVEFRTMVINNGNTAANNVVVRGQLPNILGLNLVTTSFISADNAQIVSDTATVNVSGTEPQRLIYLPGHARMVGPGCSGNGCPLSDDIVQGGVNIGNVNPGGTNAVQVIFKATLTNYVPTTPTPTPTATPTPSPTPVPPGPTSSCTSLTASVTSGTRPLTVTFTGAGTDSAGSIQAYQFDFGDNSNGQDQIVTTTNNQASHVYNNAGSFLARLLVRDSRGVWVGSGNTSCQVNINVNNPPQVLGATAPPTLPDTGSNGVLLVIAAPVLIGIGTFLFKKYRLI